MLRPQIPVAKEGVPFILFPAFCTLILAILGCSLLTAIGLIITLFILMFFRDPERFTPIQDRAIISPADGKVIEIEQMFDKRYLHKDVIKVSIFMNVFNVHVNRIPIDGLVKEVIHSPGKFYSADSHKGALQNENCATILTTTAGDELAFVQVAGLIARRIICWLEPNDTVSKGRRFGLIRFGSRVDLYLPPSSTVKVKVGEKVRAGETLMATLIAQ